MGSAPSCKKFLWQPSDRLRIDRDAEDRLVRDDGWIEATLKSSIGAMAWKFSSWSDLVSRVDRDQARFVTSLQEAIDPEGSADTEITDVRLVHLEGHAGHQREPRTGFWALLPDGTPRISMYLDHQGHQFGSTTAVNAGNHTRMAPIPPLPSLEAFGIQGPLQDVMDREQVSKSSYAIKLSHTHSVTQLHPPGGAFEWTCKIVLLIIRVAVRCDVVLQLTSGEPGNDGYAMITASNLSGEEVCVLRLHLQDTDVASLVLTLAKECGQSHRSLRLVFPDGTVADWKRGSMKIFSLFNFDAKLGQ